MHDYGLLSPEYDPSEFYIQSTNVNRTITSAYSELMGLYPPGQGARLTPMMVDAVSTVAKPPFAVRDADKINKKLGQNALPGAY